MRHMQRPALPQMVHRRCALHRDLGRYFWPWFRQKEKHLNGNKESAKEKKFAQMNHYWKALWQQIAEVSCASKFWKLAFTNFPALAHDIFVQRKLCRFHLPKISIFGRHNFDMRHAQSHKSCDIKSHKKIPANRAVQNLSFSVQFCPRFVWATSELIHHSHQNRTVDINQKKMMSRTPGSNSLNLLY